MLSEEIFRWMWYLLELPSRYYGTIPIFDLYKIFKRNRNIPEIMDMDEKAFTEAVRHVMLFNEQCLSKTKINGTASGVNGVNGIASGMASGANEIKCRIDKVYRNDYRNDYENNGGNNARACNNSKTTDDELISTVLSKSDIARIRSQKEASGLSTYILTYDEVIQINEVGYFVSPASEALKNFIMNLGFTQDKAEIALYNIASDFNQGKLNVEDVIEKVGNEKIIRDFYNTIGQVSLCGWSPEKLQTRP